MRPLLSTLHVSELELVEVVEVVEVVQVVHTGTSVHMVHVDTDTHMSLLMTQRTFAAHPSL